MINESFKSTIKVVVFGSIPLAEKVLRHLSKLDKVQLLGVITSENPIPKWHNATRSRPVFNTAQSLDIPLLDYDTLLSLEPHLGFTVRYHDILSGNILNVFKRGIVNFHGGWLPQYRGVDIPIHVILNEEEYYGVTLHYLEEGVDEGPIIARNRVMVSPEDTSYDLFLEGQRLLWDLFQDNINSILSDRIEATPQKELPDFDPNKINRYRREDLDGLKKIDPQSTPEKILKFARAFDFPGHQPAYLDFQNAKIYLRLNDESVNCYEK